MGLCVDCEHLSYRLSILPSAKHMDLCKDSACSVTPVEHCPMEQPQNVLGGGCKLMGCNSGIGTLLQMHARQNAEHCSTC